MEFSLEEGQTERKLPEPGVWGFVVEEAREHVKERPDGTVSLGIKMKLHLVSGVTKLGTCYEYIMASKSAAWKTKEFLASVLPASERPVGAKIELSPDFLVGRRGRAEFIHRTYNGTASLSVKKYLPKASDYATNNHEQEKSGFYGTNATEAQF